MKIKEKKILFIIIISLIALDQILKVIFLKNNFIIGSTEGWSIGMLQNTKSENNIQYILISIIAIMALIRYITRNNLYIKMDSRVVISFSIAGVISNLIDRIWNQGTINYINIPMFSAINLGYVYIIVTWIGMAAILTKHSIERRKVTFKNENEKEKESEIK